MEKIVALRWELKMEEWNCDMGMKIQGYDANAETVPSILVIVGLKVNNQEKEE